MVLVVVYFNLVFNAVLVLMESSFVVFLIVGLVFVGVGCVVFLGWGVVLVGGAVLGAVGLVCLFGLVVLLVVLVVMVVARWGRGGPLYLAWFVAAVLVGLFCLIVLWMVWN